MRLLSALTVAVFAGLLALFWFTRVVTPPPAVALWTAGLGLGCGALRYWRTRPR